MSVPITEKTTVSLPLSPAPQAEAQNANTQKLALPSVQKELDAPYFPNKKSFKQFVAEKRDFCGLLNESRRAHILARIQGKEHEAEFKALLAKMPEFFTFRASYKDLIDAYAEPSKQSTVNIRGGMLRYLFNHRWFESACNTLFPHEPPPLNKKKSQSLPPDFDVCIDASDSTSQALTELDIPIFKHIATILSRTTPHLEDHYFILASLCCASRRETVAVGGEYTLTTIQSNNGPDLEIVIYRHFERRFLCRSDNLQLSFYSDELKCSDDNELSSVIRDNYRQILTVPNPDKVKGFGLGRLLSLVTDGRIIQDQDIITHLKQLETAKLCEQINRACQNHHGSSLTHLCAMYWNLYMLTGNPAFKEKACEVPVELQFQKYTNLNEWLLEELKNPKGIQIEWVEMAGSSYIRVFEEDVYWFAPAPELNDADLAAVIARAPKNLPQNRLSALLGSVDMTLPPESFFMQSPYPRWYPHALKLVDSLPDKAKKKALKNMIESSHDHAVPHLVQFCGNAAPDGILFFCLTNRVRQCRMNTSLLVPTVNEIGLKLPACKNSPGNQEALQWLIQREPDIPKAIAIYNHFRKLNILKDDSSVLTAKVNINALNSQEILDHPLFPHLPQDERKKQLRRVLQTTAPLFLDHFFYRCYTEQWVSAEEAQDLCKELMPRFSFVNADWILDLFPEDNFPIDVFRKLPVHTAQYLSGKILLSELHFYDLINRLEDNLAELDNVYTANTALVIKNKEILYPRLLALALRLIDSGRFDHALPWLKLILPINKDIPKNCREPFLRCCRETSFHDGTAILTLSNPDTTESEAHALLQNRHVSTEYKTELASKFPVKDMKLWRKCVESCPLDSGHVGLLMVANTTDALPREECDQFLLNQFDLMLAKNIKVSAAVQVIIMARLKDRLKTQHYDALFAALPEYLDSADCLAIIVDLIEVFFLPHDNLYEQFLLMLANHKKSEHRKSVFVYLENRWNLPTTHAIGRKVLKCAHQWECDDEIGDRLFELNQRLYSSYESLEERMDRYHLLTPIRANVIQALCGHILTAFRADTQEEFATLTQLIDEWFDANATDNMNQDVAIALRALLTSILENFPAESTWKIAFGVKLTIYVRIRTLKHVVTRTPPDPATMALIFASLEFMHREMEILHLNQPIYPNLAKTCIHLMEVCFLLSSDANISETLFPLAWDFLSYSHTAVVPASEGPCDLRLLQHTSSLIPYAPIVVEKRKIELENKLAFVKAMIRGLTFKEVDYFLTYNLIASCFRSLITQYPHNSKEIIPLIHEFVFSTHSPTAQGVAEKRRAACASFTLSVWNLLDFRKNPKESVEILFYTCNNFDTRVNKPTAIPIAVERVLACASSGDPYWVVQGIILAADLSTHLDDRSALVFQRDLFKEVGKSLGKMDYPLLGEDFLIDSVLSSFIDSSLIKKPGGARNGTALMLEAFTEIVLGSIGHIRNVAKNQKQLLKNLSPDLYTKLLSFTDSVAKKNTSSDMLNLWFAHIEKILELGIEINVNFNCLAQLIVATDHRRLTSRPDLRTKRFDLMRKTMDHIASHDRDSVMLRGVYAISATGNWYAASQDGEQIRAEILAKYRIEL